jgi:NAD:arginine ADP-ribosyltransferase
VRALLNEHGVDAKLEPLVTAYLQEMRTEKPNRTRKSVKAQPVKSPTLSPRLPRLKRFTGVPPEVISTSRSWVLQGSDASIQAGEVEALENMALSVFVFEEGSFEEIIQGNFAATIARAANELDRIKFGSETARDVLNRYYRGVKESTGLTHFQCGVRATIMLYTDDRFFRILNDRWRRQRSRELLAFSTLMSMAFRQAAYFIQGEVYRGVDLSDVDHYQQGLVFRWPSFVSASKHREVASAFGRTLVTIEVPSSANVRGIDRWSLFPDEGEVLFRAYEIFEVLKSSPGEIRLGVFEDEFFGTGFEIGENREIRQIR